MVRHTVFTQLYILMSFNLHIHLLMYFIVASHSPYVTSTRFGHIFFELCWEKSKLNAEAIPCYIYFPEYSSALIVVMFLTKTEITVYMNLVWHFFHLKLVRFMQMTQQSWFKIAGFKECLKSTIFFSSINKSNFRNKYSDESFAKWRDDIFVLWFLMTYRENDLIWLNRIYVMPCYWFSEYAFWLFRFTLVCAHSLSEPFFPSTAEVVIDKNYFFFLLVEKGHVFAQSIIFLLICQSNVSANSK